MALLLLSVMVCVSIGTVALPLPDVWHILIHRIPGVGRAVHADWPVSSEQIVEKVRLPRILLAMLVGSSLSVAGAGFQGVLRNPLADPYTLGVATGSSVGAAVLILFGMDYIWFGIWTIPFAAFLSGVLTLVAVIRLASHQGKMKMETLILSGVVIQAFLGSVVSFLVSLSHRPVNEIMYWMMGSLAMRGWQYPLVLLPFWGCCLVLLVGFSRQLNLLSLGEAQAAHGGVHVERTKLIVLTVSTLLTAAAVSVTGVVGFVGLIVPHLVRLLVGPDYRLIVPLSAIAGAIYMLWADTLARMLLSPTEIPLGVITAFLGAPFFAYLLYKHKKIHRAE